LTGSPPQKVDVLQIFDGFSFWGEIISQGKAKVREPQSNPQAMAVFSQDGLEAASQETGGVGRLRGELSQGPATVLLLEVREYPTPFRGAPQARDARGHQRARAEERGIIKGAFPAIIIVGGAHLPSENQKGRSEMPPKGRPF